MDICARPSTSLLATTFPGTGMAEEPLTPGQDQGDESCYADYSQQDLPGSEAFVTGLMEVMTGPPIPQHGIRIIPKDSDEQPVPGTSVRE
ncbi:hypothetical protein LTR28_003359, partial [Elasticomyces elasticus]